MSRLLEIGLSNAVMATLLAIAAFALCRLCRRPALAHGLWLVVLLKLVTPPLVPVPMPWFDSQEAADPDAGAVFALVVPEPDIGPQPDEVVSARILENVILAGSGPGAAKDNEGPASGFIPLSWCLPIFVVWLAGSAVTLVWIGQSVVRFRRLLQFARLADPAIQDMVKELAGKLRLSRHPRVWLVPGKISPMLWALGAPRLIFPAELLDRLDREQCRTIFLHELAHWRRRDPWVRLLELVVAVLYWWHPAAWWARAELRDAEEQCCDAWVVGTLERAHRTYALALLETVAFLSQARLPLPVSASGIGQVSHLRRRLTMIMSGQTRRSLTWTGCVGLASFGLVLLPLIPVPAQQPEKKESRGTIIVGETGKLQILLGSDPAPDQEAAELLRRALKILAEKKQPQPDSAPKQGSAEEIKKAREQVEALAKQVANQRLELERAEARMREAQARLAALQGQTGRKGVPLQFQLQLPDPGQKKAPGTDPKAKGGFLLPAQMELQIQDGKAIVWGKKQESRLSPEEMKNRLDRLLREIEELRREIHRVPPTNAPQQK